MQIFHIMLCFICKPCWEGAIRAWCLSRPRSRPPCPPRPPFAQSARHVSILCTALYASVHIMNEYCFICNGPFYVQLYNESEDGQPLGQRGMESLGRRGVAAVRAFPRVHEICSQHVSAQQRSQYWLTVPLRRRYHSGAGAGHY